MMGEPSLTMLTTIMDTTTTTKNENEKESKRRERKKGNPALRRVAPLY